MEEEKDLLVQICPFYTENIFEKIGEKDVSLDDASDDDSDDESDDSDSDYDCVDNSAHGASKDFSKKSREFKIYLFGRTSNNKTISIIANNFTPYYYINIPNNWDKDECNEFISWILEQLDKGLRDGLVRTRIENKKSFHAFTNNENYKFLKLVFKNSTTMSKTVDIFIGKRPNPSEPGNDIRFFKTFTKSDFTYYPKLVFDGDDIEFKLYESNIDPILRFIHIQNIQPCGWVKVKAGDYNINSPKQTTCQLDITCEIGIRLKRSIALRICLL